MANRQCKGDDKAKWFAWTRTQYSAWRRVATGETEAEARAALDALPFHGRFRDVAILRKGQFPWDALPGRRL